MGSRGPVRKRDDERVRRNKPEVETTKVPVIGKVSAPELGLDDPHPIVVDLYESLNDSAQSRFYEPSDWQTARFILHFADQLMKSPKPNGQILSSVMSAFSDLLVTEGSRRRVQLEIERAEAGGVVVDLAEMYRQRLAGG